MLHLWVRSPSLKHFRKSCLHFQVPHLSYFQNGLGDTLIIFASHSVSQKMVLPFCSGYARFYWKWMWICSYFIVGVKIRTYFTKNFDDVTQWCQDVNISQKICPQWLSCLYLNSRGAVPPFYYHWSCSNLKMPLQFGYFSRVAFFLKHPV